MRLSAKGALRTRQNSRRLTNFGKMWKSGDNVHVYYPLMRDEDGSWDIVVAACWGHNVNPKEIGLKRVFIPTLSEIIDGDPKTPDVTYQFSKIAPLFVQGEKDKKMKDLEQKNMPEAMRKTAMKKVEEEFENKEAVIGKLRLVISTECVVVPLAPDGTPDTEKARLVSQDLSDKKIQQLLAFLVNQQFAPEGDTPYLEISYAFGTSGDRKEDGKVAPSGVTKDYRLASRYPELFPVLEQQISQLPEDWETVEKRNSSFRKVDENEIISALSTYSAIESGNLDELDEEGVKRLVKNADIIADLQIPVTNQEVLDAVHATSSISTSVEVNALSDAPTLNNILSEHQQDVQDAKKEDESESLMDREVNSGLANLSDLAN